MLHIIAKQLYERIKPKKIRVFNYNFQLLLFNSVITKIRFSSLLKTLSAIRHKCCIPWDEDIDLFMQGLDFKKIIHFFYKYYTQHKSYTHQTNKDYYLLFAKVSNENTIFQEPISLNFEKIQGNI